MCFHFWTKFIILIALTSVDPAYLTPEIKFLLRKKNRLMRRGRFEEAQRIGLKIVRGNNCNLNKLDSLSGTAELWNEVNKLINKRGNMMNLLVLMLKHSICTMLPFHMMRNTKHQRRNVQ